MAASGITDLTRRNLYLFSENLIDYVYQQYADGPTSTSTSASGSIFNDNCGKVVMYVIRHNDENITTCFVKIRKLINSRTTLARFGERLEEKFFAQEMTLVSLLSFFAVTSRMAFHLSQDGCLEAKVITAELITRAMENRKEKLREVGGLEWFVYFANNIADSLDDPDRTPFDPIRLEAEEFFPLN